MVFDERLVLTSCLELFSYYDPQSSAQAPRSAQDQLPSGVTFDAYLSRCPTVEDVRKAVRHFQIDIRKDGMYSRMIFEHFISRCLSRAGDDALQEVIAFLGDDLLNRHDVGNHLALIKHLVNNHAFSIAQQDRLLATVFAAAELGQIPTNELGQIIRHIPSLKRRHGRLGKPENTEELVAVYRRLWNALSACRVLRPFEVYDEAIRPWLNQLLDRAPHPELYRLAAEIIVTLDGKTLMESSWIPHLVSKAIHMVLFWDPRQTGYKRTDVIRYIVGFLLQLNPDVAAKSIISITEMLASPAQPFPRGRMLRVWRDCLLAIRQTEALVSSHVWQDLEQSTMKEQGKLKPKHRIVLRLWAISALNKTRDGPMARLPPKYQSRPSDGTVTSLLKQFDVHRPHGTRDDFLTHFIQTLQSLDMPCGHVLETTMTLLTKRRIRNKSALRAFRMLERRETTLYDLVADLDAFNSTKSWFFSTYMRMITQLDVTSPEFVDMTLNLSLTPKTWHNLFRLLSFNTRLQIALGMSSVRPRNKETAHESSTGTFPATSSDSRPQSSRDGQMSADEIEPLDPAACVHVMHLLAVTIATSEQLSARNAFRAVRWIYNFLHRHNAQIQPSFARALYHCGVTRFRREGRRVAVDQYEYVSRIVREFEGRDIVDALDGWNHVDIGYDEGHRPARFPVRSDAPRFPIRSESRFPIRSDPRDDVQ